MSVHRRIEKFLRTTAMPPSTFGRRALGDPRFVHDLRRGREMRGPTIAKVDAFLAAQNEP
jgi:hypothetical protein